MAASGSGQAHRWSFPYLAEVGEQRQSLRLVSKSALMDQHAAIGVAAQDGVFDLIESHPTIVSKPPELTQQQRGGCAFAGDGNAPADRTR